MNTWEINEQLAAIGASYKDAVAKVRRDRDLSPTGREKALAKLKADKVSAVKSFVKPLREAALDTALKIRSIDLANSALDRIANDKADYSRLAYNALAVKSAISLAGSDPWKIQEAWQQARDSGDVSLIKACLDTAPALFPDKSPHESTFNELKADMQASKGLVHDQERRQYTDERRIKMDELSECARSTALLADELGGPSQAKSLIGRVFSGIAVDHASGELFLSVGNTLNETRDATKARLAAEQAERDAAQQEVAKNFGVELDPDLDSGDIGVGNEA
jgi:hypothetical protein